LVIGEEEGEERIPPEKFTLLKINLRWLFNLKDVDVLNIRRKEELTGEDLDFFLAVSSFYFDKQTQRWCAKYSGYDSSFFKSRYSFLTISNFSRTGAIFRLISSNYKGTPHSFTFNNTSNSEA